MADWSKITLLDGWTVQRDENGYTLTVQAYAESMGVFPTRYEAVPTTGRCAVPSQFAKFRFAEVTIRPLTSAGPWLADLTAKAHLTAHSTKKDSLLYQSSVSGGYMDFLVKLSYCRLKEATNGSDNPPSGMPSNFVSAFNDDAPKGDGTYTWTAWRANDANTVPSKCPFSTRPHYKFAGENVKLLAVTVSFNKREGDGLEDWAAFSGIVPVSSMPSWIKIPHGDNRWRLWDESLEYSTDGDGKRILRVRRVLLGIPNGFRDMKGNRIQWNQSLLGQKKWGDLA